MNLHLIFFESNRSAIKIIGYPFAILNTGSKILKRMISRRNPGPFALNPRGFLETCPQMFWTMEGLTSINTLLRPAIITRSGHNPSAPHLAEVMVHTK